MAWEMDALKLLAPVGLSIWALYRTRENQKEFERYKNEEAARLKSREWRDQQEREYLEKLWVALSRTVVRAVNLLNITLTGNEKPEQVEELRQFYTDVESLHYTVSLHTTKQIKEAIDEVVQGLNKVFDVIITKDREILDSDLYSELNRLEPLMRERMLQLCQGEDN